jgi:hypothetical protein
MMVMKIVLVQAMNDHIVVLSLKEVANINAGTTRNVSQLIIYAKKKCVHSMMLAVYAREDNF